MLILDGIKNTSDDRIHIPFYHRGHISLKSDTSVTMALIPPRLNVKSPQLTEIVVSPIDFRAWASLWRVEVNFLESPGVVNKLLTIIANEGLNVLNEESSSVENRDWHTVELIVDAYKFASEDINDEYLIQALEHKIIALCIENLKFEQGNPRVRIKRMKGLRDAWTKYHSSSRNESRYQPVQETSYISDGDLILPTAIQRHLPAPDKLRCHLLSDTKERLLRIFFPNENDGFTYVRIAHLDSPGALAIITAELARAFDIVNSLTRIQRQGKQNHLELLLYSGEFSKPNDEEKRQRIIKNLLSNQSFKSLKLQISFPSFIGSATPGVVPKVSNVKTDFKEQKEVARIDKRFEKLSTSAVIKLRIEDYTKRIEKEPVFSKRQPLELRLKTLRKLGKAEGEQSPQFNIFISYDFERRELLEIAVKYFKKRNFNIVTGENPNDPNRPAFRDVILDRISSSDAFLGIWTNRGDEYSPWFHWELGVAQAGRLPFRLLIHENLPKNIGQRVNPEKQHEFFNDLNFERKCKETAPILFEDLFNKRQKPIKN